MDKTLLSLEDMRALIPKLPDREGFSSSLYLCKSGPLAGQFAADVLCEPAIDQQAMSVRMRISTPQLDRVNHVVKQDGILTDYYRDNPVVLFGHGMEGIVFPVAMSEDREGNLTVERCDDGTYATAYHSKDLKFSSQMFDLVVQKFIRASSIGITPVVCSKGYDSDGDEVLFIEEGQLNEWSYCTIGVNPGARIVKSMQNYREFVDLQCDAANRILLSDRLDGTQIHPAIRKSLQAAIVVKASTPGIESSKEPEESKAMKTLSTEQIKKMKPKQLAKAIMELKEYDPETQGMLKAAVEMMPEVPAEVASMEAPAAGPEEVPSVEKSEMAAEEPAMETEDEAPLGSRVLRSLHENLGSLIDTATKALAPVENPDVKEAASDILQQIRDLATSLEGVFSSKYPDQPSLAPALEEPSEEVVKSFLSSSPRGRDQLRGLAARIETVAKACSKAGGKVSHQHLRLLGQTASDLVRMNQQAKSFKPPVVETKAEATADDSKYREAFEDLKKQFTSLSEALGQFPLPMTKS